MSPSRGTLGDDPGVLMERAAAIFARRVLFVHVGLLVVVLAAVVLSVRFLHDSARRQVSEQSRSTLELIAGQTAAGVESYYQGVLNVLDVLRPMQPGAEGRGGDGQRGPVPARGPDRPRGPEGGRPVDAPPRPGTSLPPERVEQLRVARELRISFLQALFGSIRGKIAGVFIVDLNDGSMVEQFGEAPSELCERIVREQRDWLMGQRTPTVSHFITFDEGAGGHILVIPAIPARRSIVAIAPVSGVESQMLNSINRREVSGVMLVDDRGVVMSSPDRSLVGRRLRETDDPQLAKIVADYIERGRAGSEIFPTPVVVDGKSWPPAMLSAQPVELPGKRTWWIVVGTSLDRVNQLVDPIFAESLRWAFFFMVAVTAILVSTATQLIRSRVRFERVRARMIERELTEARRIQMHWLPAAAPKSSDVEVVAANLPASHISGDFYNWFILEDGRIAVVIGDVTGHGLSAAFLMSTTQLLVRTTMARTNDPGQCLGEVNRQLCLQVFNGQFVTMLLMVIDPKRGQVEMAVAGHPPPLVEDNGVFRPLAVESQLVLGVESSSKYPTEVFRFEHDAMMLLYTDGLPDLVNDTGERLTTDGLAKMLAGAGGSAAELAESVQAAVRRFRGGRELADDLTFVALRFSPAASPAKSAREAREPVGT